MILNNKFLKSNDNNNSEQESQTDFSHRLANFTSIFVAPPTMSIVATVSFSLWSPIGLGFLSAPYTILLCIFCFALFPFLSVLYLHRKKGVDIFVSKREARTPLYLIAIASYAFGTIFFLITSTKIMFLLGLGSLFVTIILMGINLYWKVSIHCAGVSGPIFALICVFGASAIPLTSIVGLVGWSRIKTRNHTFKQTLVGTLISLSIVPIVFSMLYL